MPFKALPGSHSCASRHKPPRLGDYNLEAKYISIRNPSKIAIDISGWKVGGGLGCFGC